MAKNEHLNWVVWPIYNIETVKSKEFLYPQGMQQAQKALTFTCHFYVVLLLS